MLTPGESYPISVEGVSYLASVLSRSQQRELIQLLAKLTKVEETIESLSTVLDIADSVAGIVLHGYSSEQLDNIPTDHVWELANESLEKHVLGVADKKKSESPHLSAPGKSQADVPPPSVFATSVA